MSQVGAETLWKSIVLRHNESEECEAPLMVGQCWLMSHLLHVVKGAYLTGARAHSTRLAIVTVKSGVVTTALITLIRQVLEHKQPSRIYNLPLVWKRYMVQWSAQLKNLPEKSISSNN